MKNIPIFCVFSLILLISGVYILFENFSLIMDGEQYQGRITSFKYKTGADSHPQRRGTRRPVVEFIGENKQKKVVSTINIEFYFKNYSINEPVYVYFDSKTERLIISDIYSLWSQPLFLIILGSLICYFGRDLKRK